MHRGDQVEDATRIRHPGTPARGEQKNSQREFYAYKRKNGYGTPPAIWVDWIELEGPITEAPVHESRIVRVEPEQTINPDNEKEIAKSKNDRNVLRGGRKESMKQPRLRRIKAIIAEIRKTNRLIDHPNRFYTFADRFKGTPNPSDFGFRDSAKAAAADPSAKPKSGSITSTTPPAASRPRHLLEAGSRHRSRHCSPKERNLPPGSYVMRVRVGAVKGTPASRRFIQVGHPQRQIESRNWGLEGRAISSHQVTGTIENPKRSKSRLRSPSNRFASSPSRRNSPTRET